jgi:hypothetical protein
MLLTGTLTGNTYITQVALKNVTGLIGHFEQCVIREGTNTLGGAGIGMLQIPARIFRLLIVLEVDKALPLGSLSEK